MRVIVRNIAEVPNKYVKLLKWKMYNLSEKFKDLIYIEAFINSEGRKPTESLLYSLGMIAVAGILYCLQLSIESYSLQIKLGFLSKILLIVGIISLWLFGIPDTVKNKKSSM